MSVYLSGDSVKTSKERRNSMNSCLKANHKTSIDQKTFSSVQWTEAQDRLAMVEPNEGLPRSHRKEGAALFSFSSI